MSCLAQSTLPCERRFGLKGRLNTVLACTVALGVHVGKSDLRVCMALICCPLEPIYCLLSAFRHALAVSVSLPQLVLRGGVTSIGGLHTPRKCLRIILL